MTRKPLVLIIRDGWGYRKEKDHNAIKEAGTPHTDQYMKNYPNTLLEASGEAVGLPKGYQGNSEVGHLTIGSGRIIAQSLARINKAIKKKTFFKNEAFLKAINNCKKEKTTLHLIGLLQREGVHAHLEHLFALLDLCQQEGYTKVKIHVITDGRDAPVTKSLTYLKELKEKIKQLGFGEISSISGRYYAMDRDKRWDRTQQFYEAIVNAQTNTPNYTEPEEAIRTCHEKGETDEFIKPRIKENYQGIQEKDGIIFYNFRTDRPRQFTHAMTDNDFKEFPRKKVPKTTFIAMTQYYRPMNAEVAFKDQDIRNTLGEVVSKKGLKQLRISETEKYAHVTFFFNAEREQPYPGEERILIPSPKVATYDLQPEMSAPEITKQLVKAIDEERYDLIITNIVNGDMVGHTGNIKACHEAVRTVDNAIDAIIKATLAKQGTALVFADHGNIEDQTEKWRTSHTLNPVPFILISDEKELKNAELKEGKGLQDIAPTTLALLGIEQPPEMTGENIIKNFKKRQEQEKAP